MPIHAPFWGVLNMVGVNIPNLRSFAGFDNDNINISSNNNNKRPLCLLTQYNKK